MSMEMNKANECTCPSGDGSLVHPCPAHPAVEQAGGDERAAFKTAYLAEFDCDADGDDNMAHSNTAWRAWKMARAALAQPSPAPVCTTPTGENCPGDGVKSCKKCPEQAEAERPEVVARVVHSNPVVLGQCGPLNANDELMTVAQHAASVARWAEMFNRVEQQRDSALARVAELEGKLTDWVHEGFRLNEALAVAKAQHSVPDDDMILQIFADNAEHSEQGDEHGYCIVREQHAQAIARKLLAAAPGKEGA